MPDQKTLGHKAPKPAVSDYLAWFEDAYVLFMVRIFDASPARANTNPKKIDVVPAWRFLLNMPEST